MSSGADRETIARLFLSRYGLLVGVAMRYAPAPDLIDDIVQQAFVDFVEDVENNDRDLEKDATPLLYKITKHRAIKFWNRRRRGRSEVLQQIAERLAADPRPEDLAKIEEEIRTLRHCLEKLPPQSRELIETHYHQGISMEEIARRENRKPGTIRQIFCRIRDRLRECIQKNIDVK